MFNQVDHNGDNSTTVYCMDDCTYIRLPVCKALQLLRPIKIEQTEIIHWSQYQGYADQYYFRSVAIYMKAMTSNALYTSYGGSTDSFLANLPKRTAMCLSCYSRIVLKHQYIFRDTLFDEGDSNEELIGTKPLTICPHCEKSVSNVVWE
jgi:hypothetical protein